MPPKMRRREARPSQAPRRQRGAIAVMAAVSIVFIIFPMLGLVTMTGFYLNQRRQLVNYADSVSAAWGLQMVQTARSDWRQRYFDGQTLARGHGYSANMPSVTAPVFRDTLDLGPSGYERYTPSYAAVTASAPFRLLTMARAFSFTGNIAESLSVMSRVRVNQVTLASNVLYRQPVMLMLDFSSTMRLSYQTKNGTSSSESAAQALQRVAKQLIDDSTYVYDLGIQGFSDDSFTARKRVQTPAGDSNNPNPKDAWLAEGSRRRGMASAVTGWQADGDGTNIEAAIKASGSYLAAAEHAGLPLQKPMMIIVTDGEPNLSSSAVKGGTSSLEDRQKAAATDALGAMDQQRRATNQGFPAGVDALVLQILREQKAGLGDADEKFLRTLAGPGTSNGAADANWFHQDNGDPNELTRIMQRLPKYPVCEFSVDLRGLNGYNINNAAPPAIGRDVLGAFVALDDAQNEIAIDGNNIFTKLNDWRTWVIDPRHAAYLTYGSDPEQQTITTNPIKGDNTTGIEVLRKYPNDFLAVYIDPSTSKVYVSGMLCAALNLPRINQNLRLRIRYGYPQLADKNDAAKFGR